MDKIFERTSKFSWEINIWILKDMQTNLYSKSGQKFLRIPQKFHRNKFQFYPWNKNNYKEPRQEKVWVNLTFQNLQFFLQTAGENIATTSQCLNDHHQRKPKLHLQPWKEDKLLYLLKFDDNKFNNTLNL